MAMMYFAVLCGGEGLRSIISLEKLYVKLSTLRYGDTLNLSVDFKTHVCPPA
jgi:hypothetical protein